MHKRIALALVGLLGLATLSTQVAEAAGPGDTSGSSALQLARDLKPTHGGGTSMGHGYVPLHARAYAKAKAAANRRAGVGGPAAQAASTSPVVTAYPNVSPSFSGTYQSGLTPPDTTGAIGPDRYIETVNTSYAIYDRAGSQVNSGSLSALTNINGGFFGHSLSDPQMMWDPTTQRFYYVALYYDSLFLSDNGLAIGWSKTATPTSSSDFCQYTLSFGGGFPDYPKLGDSHDFLIVGYNEFSSGASVYDGSAFVTVNKPPAGSACAPVSQFVARYSGLLRNADNSLAATPVPANLVDHDAGAGYVVANADLTATPSADFLTTWTVTTSGTDSNGIPIPAMSGPSPVTLPTYAMPASAPQQGSSYLLDTLDGRFEAAVAARDPDHGNAVTIWTAHAVSGGPGAEERWYEVDPAGGSLVQHGTAGTPTLFTWNGAISPDRADDGTAGSHGNSMAMSVSTSSTTTYPAIQFVSKAGSAAQSPLSALVQAGGANVDFSCSSTAACRWGDYSAASPDPAAGGGSAGRVWLGNQYNLAGGTTSSTVWRTWLFAVTPTTPSSAALSFTPGPQTLVAGSPSAAMRVGLSSPQGGDVTVHLTSSSSGGQFATSTGGPWSSTLDVTIPLGQTLSPVFYYRDTRAGTPTLTASASGFTSASQTETVSAAALSTITVSPSTANMSAGDTQVFTASGSDQFGNPVGVSSATWTTTAPGSLSSSSGTSTTFTAGPAGGSGDVIATVGTITGSATVTVTTATTAPPAPTNLTAKVKGRRVSLSWTGSSGVTYNVYRGTTSGGEGTTPVVSGLTSTSYNDSGVTSGTTYWYYVTAVGSGGESPPSREVSARVR